jgi:hypothetical protein
MLHPDTQTDTDTTGSDTQTTGSEMDTAGSDTTGLDTAGSDTTQSAGSDASSEKKSDCKPPKQFVPFGPTALGCLLLVFSFGMSKRAYEALRRILQAPWFRVAEMPTYKTLKTYTKKLPVIPVHTTELQTADGKKKAVPRHALRDVIKRCLQTKDNLAQMVFRPSVGKWSKEFWHGSLWRSSPLFTRFSFHTDRCKFHLGDYVVFGHDQNRGRVVTSYEDETSEEWRLGVMPLHLVGGRELLASYDEEISICQEDVIATFECGRTSECGSWFCSKAARANGGNVQLSDLPQHPSDQLSREDRDRLEEATQLANSRGTRILRIFLCIFYDGFGAFNKIYHKVHMHTPAPSLFWLSFLLRTFSLVKFPRKTAVGTQQPRSEDAISSSVICHID